MPVISLYNSDELIMEGIRRNDRTAIEILYRLNAESFFNYVKTNSGTVQEAKDVLQDAIIIIYYKIMQGTLVLENASLKTYLTSICQHLWLKRLRSRGKLIPFTGDLFNKPDDQDFELMEPLDDQEIRLYRYIRMLDERCREILRLRFWMKMKMEEVAHKLHERVQTIRMKSSRCIRRLYKIFNKNQ